MLCYGSNPCKYCARSTRHITQSNKMRCYIHTVAITMVVHGPGLDTDVIIGSHVEPTTKAKYVFNLNYAVWHYNDVITGAMAYQISSHTSVYSTVFSGADKKKTPTLCVTGLCEVNSPVTGEFPTQRVSNAEKVSIWWRHHGSWYLWYISSRIRIKIIVVVVIFIIIIVISIFVFVIMLLLSLLLLQLCCCCSCYYCHHYDYHHYCYYHYQ